MLVSLLTRVDTYSRLVARGRVVLMRDPDLFPNSQPSSSSVSQRSLIATVRLFPSFVNIAKAQIEGSTWVQCWLGRTCLDVLSCN